MAVVTPKQIDGSLLAAGTPTYRLAVGNSYAVGDFVVVEIVQNVHATPGVVTDSLGNTYRQVIGRVAEDYANLDANGNPTDLQFGFGLYVSQITVAGSRPTLTFTMGATGMVGLRSYTGVDLGLNTRGRPIAPISVAMNSRTVSPFITDADVQSVGDMAVACIVAMSGSVTFNTNSFASPGWNTVRTIQGNGLSLQLLEQAPSATGTVIAGWDTTPTSTTAITSGLSLPHA